MDYKRFWEMKKPGMPGAPHREIFKCTGCGAETNPEKGWNGAPDPGRCASGCKHDHGDWKNAVSAKYRENYDKIRWDVGQVSRPVMAGRNACSTR